MQNTPSAATATWGTAELIHASKHFDQKRALSLTRRETVRVTALNDVSFQIKRGEFVAYAGPNGAGKSTTFKLLCGMLAPDAGQTRVFGVDPLKDRIRIMRKTGVLFGNRSELWWDHPVRTSFEWKKAVWSIPDATYDDMLRHVTDLLGLHEILNTFSRELSLGQRMRANLGMTMLHAPELLLLDEPTLGLDVLAKRMMIEFLKRINRESGVTILVTSHDMDDLTEMAGRLLLISKGAIAFDGAPDELHRAGTRRTLRLSVPGEPPRLPGAELIGRENGGYAYAYDAGEAQMQALLRALADVPGVTDVETGRAPIESVIADLYRQWA